MVARYGEELVMSGLLEKKKNEIESSLRNDIYMCVSKGIKVRIKVIYYLETCTEIRDNLVKLTLVSFFLFLTTCHPRESGSVVVGESEKERLYTYATG